MSLPVHLRVADFAHFLLFPTRFRRNLAGIAGCVLCIHAICREPLFRDKSGLAFLLVDRLLVAGLFPDHMYNQHTSRFSYHFLAKSCRRAMKQQLYMRLSGNGSIFA